MLSVKASVKRLTHRLLLAQTPIIDLNVLCKQFKPDPLGSLTALLKLMNQIAGAAQPSGGSPHPYYRRRIPAPQRFTLFDSDGSHIDLKPAHLPPYPDSGTTAEAQLQQAIALFDARAASTIMDSAKPTTILDQQAAIGSVNDQGNAASLLNNSFLELKDYGYGPLHFTPFYTLRTSALAMMAYKDFFPDDHVALAEQIPADAASLAQTPSIAAGFVGEWIGDYLRDLVNVGIMVASPGWCGTFGPTVDGLPSLALFNSEGNYDMTLNHLVPMAYSYYDELSSDASERLITQLMAGGRVHRPNLDDTFTSGTTPNDWSRAGYVSPTDALPIKLLTSNIPETENHIISIVSSRYLTNQLLYQRDPQAQYDNRRNNQDGPTTMSLVLAQLRNILRDDFSEYNAKSYQEETRWPILNLATYAYDHEVRLAARMVLDYLSAHMAVSSSDLRRLLPFRRRNEGYNVARNDQGVMLLAMLEGSVGADPMAPYFAVQAGNVRAWETPNMYPDPNNPDHPPLRKWEWGIAHDGGDIAKEALSAYRLPLPIHDLFVNDSHRRFFQRLHRKPQPCEVEGARNCDMYEIFAGSASYLITAGGEPTQYALDPGPFVKFFSPSTADQEKGICMPTSFIPTGTPGGAGTQNWAIDVIQFSRFSDNFDDDGVPEYKNYGVAPDFACGLGLHLPNWVQQRLDVPMGQATTSPFHFANFGSGGNGPGFYLAIHQNGDYALMEAFDTWLNPNVAFEDFQDTVIRNNAPDLGTDLPGGAQGERGGTYITYFNTVISYVIWSNHTKLAGPDSTKGAVVSGIRHSPRYPADSMGDAGNTKGPFLNGTILNSAADAVVYIRNPFYGPDGATITLDMYANNGMNPRRISETGETEQAGFNNEVWVNFGWKGPAEGDFFRPFNRMAAAVDAVADGGVIRVVPGWTNERLVFKGSKRYKLIAPIGNVHIGVW